MARVAILVLGTLISTAPGTALQSGAASGTLTVDGGGVTLEHVATRVDEILGKRYTAVILTQAPVPALAVEKDTLYQLAYQKAIQGIRMRFDENRKLIGVILYHSAINGPSVEYQGFAEFTYRAGAPAAISGTVTMDYTDTGGRVIKIDATFDAPRAK
jgi:hypothetical protein